MVTVFKAFGQLLSCFCAGIYKGYPPWGQKSTQKRPPVDNPTVAKLALRLIFFVDKINIKVL